MKEEIISSMQYSQKNPITLNDNSINPNEKIPSQKISESDNKDIIKLSKKIIKAEAKKLKNL